MKRCLEELITEAYRIRGANYITIKGNITFWSDKASAGHLNVGLAKILEYISFLIDNIFIRVGNRIFKQVIGIPMGTDCAPLLANLFLFFYEYKYIKSKLSTNHKEAILFKHTVRYIDDLLTLNNPLFEAEIPKIYPPELELKKTTEAIDRLSYLDLYIDIIDHQFITSVYDKRDSFKFSIVNFPHLDGNIPSKPAYGIYISQLVRFGRICDKKEDFIERHFRLTTRLIKQGYRYDKLCYTFKKFCSRYKSLLDKFGVHIKYHVKKGIALPINCINRLGRFITVR